MLPLCIGVASGRSVLSSIAFVTLTCSCLVARADNHPWTMLAILSGDFAATRRQLESIRDAEDPALASPTLVLHDPPGDRDTILYEARYCPKELRQSSGCLEGGSQVIGLETIGIETADVSLADLDTLALFARFIVERYASDRLMIVLKGRSSFGHLLRDDDEPREMGMDLPALRSILRAARDARGSKVDLLVLASSASAAVETAFAVREDVDHLVATQQSTGDGRSAYFRLSTWRRMLRDNPVLEPRELARLIANNYRDPSYPSFDPAQSYAIAALDLKAMDELFPQLGTLHAALLDADLQGIPLLEERTADTWHYGAQQTRVDLGGLLTALSPMDEESATSTAALHARISLSNSVISNFAQPEGGPTALSVFFPIDPATQWQLRKKYRSRFAPYPQESGWLEVLRARAQYHRSLATGCSGVSHSTRDEPSLALWRLCLPVWLICMLRRRGSRAAPTRRETPHEV